MMQRMGRYAGDAVLQVMVGGRQVDVPVTVGMHWGQDRPWGAGAPASLVSPGPAVLYLPNARHAEVNIGDPDETETFQFIGVGAATGPLLLAESATRAGPRSFSGPSPRRLDDRFQGVGR